ncbi:LysM peptidoglycan-binding and 3D domain-containing protein [Lederbergia citrea]|uniref:LysM peptidoglycan-binding and 3D domain-containing protein n=1 Tax=Lederbergia citrea TaxID=2833581 RepID=UPI001BC9A656|nr:3D domain-containing protein [Lederbergia citrea]MBS4203494.1 LysM peptidoglycan-binding domain-containing protein [Lederbergia citrea]
MRKTITTLAAAVTLTGIFAGGASAATYEVQKGDTLWSISQNHGTTVEQLKTWNELSSDLIFPTEQLEIDGQKNKEHYTVAPGDTLWDISKKYRVTVNELKDWNNLKSDIIHPGDSLYFQTVEHSKSESIKTNIINKKTIAAKPVQSKANAKTSDNEMTVTATAYTAFCKGCSGVTATGQDLRANPDQKVIAVDPKVIPLGSKVYVEGYGTAVAGDTGGAIKGNKIDLFIPSTSDALDFGVQTVKIKILN